MNKLRYFSTLFFLISLSSSTVLPMQPANQESGWSLTGWVTPLSQFATNMLTGLFNRGMQGDIPQAEIDVVSTPDSLQVAETMVTQQIARLEAQKATLTREIAAAQGASKIQKNSTLMAKKRLLTTINLQLQQLGVNQSNLCTLQSTIELKVAKAEAKKQIAVNDTISNLMDTSTNLTEAEKAEFEAELAELYQNESTENDEEIERALELL